jgi:hypothetical protein
VSPGGRRKGLLQMNRSIRETTWASWALLSAIALGLLGGCKDKQKCDEAVQTTRQAIGVENMPLARQWREFTWKVCADTALQSTIDQEILNKEKELRTRVEDAAKKAREDAEAKLKEAGDAWHDFDRLEEKERTESKLKETNTKAKRLARGLQEPYATQIQDYNTKQFQKRMKRLEKK